MALLDFSRAPSRSVTTVDRVHSAVSNAFGTFAAWNDARRTRNTLSKLSAHELEDIGLSRGDIERVIRTGTF